MLISRKVACQTTARSMAIMVPMGWYQLKMFIIFDTKLHLFRTEFRIYNPKFVYLNAFRLMAGCRRISISSHATPGAPTRSALLSSYVKLV